MHNLDQFPHIAPRLGAIVKYKSQHVIVEAWAQLTDTADAWRYVERRNATSIIIHNSDNILECLAIADLTIESSLNLDPNLYNLLVKTNFYLSCIK